jgi:hypothetical protein
MLQPIIKHLMLITSILINGLKIRRSPQITSDLWQTKTISSAPKIKLCQISAPLFLG